MGSSVWRDYSLGVIFVLISAAAARAEAGQPTTQGLRANPGLRVQSALVAIVSWDIENRPGGPLRFHHLGTGFLATETGWIVTLGHVLAARPENATYSVIAFVSERKVTELPVVEGPFYPSDSSKTADLCLLKVGRVPPQMNPVDFACRVETAKQDGIRSSNRVSPCDEIGVYATLLEDLASTPERASVIHRYARKGIVSAISPFEGREEVYFLDVVGFSGYSGGPVFRWDTGSVLAVVTSLEARQQRFNEGDPQNDFNTYFMHGIRAVPVTRCVDVLLGRGETVRFVDPGTSERFQFSLSHGRQPVQP
jgi:hypothetical protein